MNSSVKHPDVNNAFIALEDVRLSGLFCRYLRDPNYASVKKEIIAKMKEDWKVDVPDDYTPNVGQGFTIASAYAFLVWPKELIRAKRQNKIINSDFPTEDELLVSYNFLVSFGKEPIEHFVIENNEKINNLTQNSIVEDLQKNPFHLNYPNLAEEASKFSALLRCLRNALAHGTILYTPDHTSSGYSMIFINTHNE